MQKGVRFIVICLVVLAPFVALGQSGSTLLTEAVTTDLASVVGALAKGSGTFVIDHPLDPENKLLFHSFVESPDVKNIYDGVAELDSGGEATIELPWYFMELNEDYRYLATAIGEPMPNLYLKEGVKTNEFTIAGGVPGGRVSWQVTGVRHDPYILANPIIPEVEKSPNEIVNKGEYLSPELYE